MLKSTLPTSRDFVTQLLNSFPSLSRNNAEAKPLTDAPEPVKKQLLTLQVLFPNEFLPALDLLDRKLVTCFRLGVQELDRESQVASNTISADVQMQDDHEPVVQEACPVSPNTPKDAEIDTVYYVRSAQQRSSRFSTAYDSTTSYEVRLRAWNCTCPAFAFAAFPSAHSDVAVPTYTPPTTLEKERSAEAERVQAFEWTFGGVSLEECMPPVCKHLLACVLAERCSGVFGDCMEERKVSMETAAGWAAGWGDL